MTFLPSANPEPQAATNGVDFIVVAPRESDKRLVHPQDITYNDVAVCGSDTITSTLVSNPAFQGLDRRSQVVKRSRRQLALKKDRSQDLWLTPYCRVCPWDDSYRWTGTPVFGTTLGSTGPWTTHWQYSRQSRMGMGCSRG